MTRSTLFALFLLPALASAQPPAKADPGRAALLQTDVEWARVASAGKDVEKILSYWSDDAVAYPPGVAAVSGKAAIRKYVSTSLKTPFFSISWKPAQAVVAASGDLGYTMGSNEITFAKKYRTEMKRPEALRLLALLAALSLETDFAVGCYCPDEMRCHRSVLRNLLEEHGARLA